ncbi:MAG TPA: prolipoprotein diacylglyceryl transferase [Opitutaceae bacterium]|jgi:phosphatidylglycerol:prolipoprotein diacylglycerol transferase
MTPPLAYWVDNLDPFIVRIHGNFGLRYYGLAYVLGLLAGGWLLVRYSRAGRSLLPAAVVGDFIVTTAIGVYAGGRIGLFLLYDGWRELRSDPLALFKVWDGGMSFHGGLVGVIIAVWWFARRAKIRLLHLWDVVATAAPAGLFFGRVANFVNGELWGKPSTVPWAVIFPRSATEDRPDLLVPRHPSQLYEAGMEGVLLFAYMQWRFWKTDAVRRRPGALSGEFLVLYGCLRIAGEVFREPDASLILGLSRGTFYSCIMIVFGLFLRLRPSKPLEMPAAGNAA